MKIQNNIKSYLAVATGSCCAASFAHGAVVFYGPGAQSSTTTPPTPDGFNISLDSGAALVGSFDEENPVLFNYSGGDYFTQGGDLAADVAASIGYYIYGGEFTAGAMLGDQNYANLTFDADDTVFEAVGQFFFDGADGGYLVAIATNEDGSALSISDGVDLIDAASVPEPSGLTLLALGSAGLLARRQRRKAA